MYYKIKTFILNNISCFIFLKFIDFQIDQMRLNIR